MDIALQLLSVMLLMGSGWLARRRGWITDAGAREIARVLISLILPCMIASSLLRRSAGEILKNGHLPLLSMGLAGLGLALGRIALRRAGRMSEPTRRAFLFQCLINNYLFLPLPIVQLRYGAEGVALLILSSLGFDITVWTLGVGIYSPGSRFRDRFRGLLSPPLFALAGSLAWVLLREAIAPLGGWAARPPPAAAALGGVFLNVFDFIGRATIPISMLIAGSRIAGLRPGHLADGRVALLSGIRLVAVPLLFLALLNRLPLAPTARGVLMIVSLMPTAVTAVVLSDRYGGDTDFVASGLLMTHLLAVVTVPLFLFLAL